MNTAIAQHLNVAESAIVRIEEWASVLFVVVRGVGGRFVSKKVAAMQQSVVYKHRFGDITMTPISKTRMSVERKGETQEMIICETSLERLGIPAIKAGAILWDLRKLSGRGNEPSQVELDPPAKSKKQINRNWLNYNNVANESGDGYNPYKKWS